MAPPLDTPLMMLSGDDEAGVECCVEMDTTERSGGMAFEVLLKPATADSPRVVKDGTPTDRRVSLEAISKKLQDAQGRREVRTMWLSSINLGLVNEYTSEA